MLTSFFVFVLFCCSAQTEDAQELVLTNDNFETEVSTGSHFVMFYAPWCGHCKRLHPIWSQLAEKYNGEQERDFVTIGKVDCTVHTDLCSDQGVTGYPTLKLFNGGDFDNGLKYRGKREVSAFDTFLAENVKSDGVEVPTTAPTPTVEEPVAPTAIVDIEDGLAKLTKATFNSHVANGVHFVKFFAPWCGHCQRMAPAWDELAKAFEDDDRVSIGRVDCTSERDLCETHGVRGYPTLLLFVNGQKDDKYQGSREFKDLFSYATKAGKKFDDMKQGTQEAIPQVDQTEEIKVEAQAPGTMALVLNDDNFGAETGTGISFIKFYAPWCGHCKRLAPTWDELATKYSSETSIKIAKVDCTQERDLCGRQSISGYPTLLLFKDGQHIAEYEETRSLDNLVAFVEKYRSKDEL